MNKYCWSLILSLIFCTSLNSQKRLAIYETDIIDAKAAKMIQLSLFEGTSSEDAVKEVPEYLISSYSKDDRFIVIDKKNQQIIKSEKERQKSEDFIDGYIVEQGKMEGADYLLRSFITNKGKDLAVRIYDVKNEKILCESSTSFKSAKSAVKFLVADINQKCFELSFEVVRVEEEKKGKAKMILILGGYGQNMGVRDNLDIYTLVSEEISGRVIERKQLLGKGIVNQVQDENFSSVKIVEGGKEINEYLSKGAKLYCTLK